MRLRGASGKRQGALPLGKGKTGMPICSQAMSEWKSSGVMSPRVAQTLGQCRSVAYRLENGGAASRQLSLFDRPASTPAPAPQPAAPAKATPRARPFPGAPAPSKPAPWRVAPSKPKPAPSPATASLLEQANARRGYVPTYKPKPASGIPKTLDEATRRGLDEVIGEIRGQAKATGRPVDAVLNEWETSTNLGRGSIDRVRSLMGNDVHNHIIRQHRSGQALEEARFRLHQSRIKRAQAKAPAAPPAPAFKLEAPAPSRARASFGSNSGRTGTMFDMKAGDLPGQTSLFDKVGTVEVGKAAARVEGYNLKFRDQLERAIGIAKGGRLEGFDLVADTTKEARRLYGGLRASQREALEASKKLERTPNALEEDRRRARVAADTMERFAWRLRKQLPKGGPLYSGPVPGATRTDGPAFRVARAKPSPSTANLRDQVAAARAAKGLSQAERRAAAAVVRSARATKVKTVAAAEHLSKAYGFSQSLAYAGDGRSNAAGKRYGEKLAQRHLGNVVRRMRSARGKR